jgi:hypothetical protein
MKIKTSELTGAALDWAVMKCEYPNNDSVPFFNELRSRHRLHASFHYSTDWAQGGPIIERESIDLIRDPNGTPAWLGRAYIDKQLVTKYAPTPLIAALRCYVASKLGDEAEVPDELIRKSPNIGLLLHDIQTPRALHNGPN